MATVRQQEEAVAEIGAQLADSETLYLIERKRTATYSALSVLYYDDAPGDAGVADISRKVADALGWGFDEVNWAVQVTGTGISRADHLVETLGLVVADDVTAYKVRVL